MLLKLFHTQVGGNKNAREFFEAQPDYDDSMSIQQKYNTKAAALYRDKVATLAQGKSWNASTSAAQNHVGSSVQSHSNSTTFQNSSTNYSSYQDNNGTAAGYQNLINTPEFKDQKDQYFNRIQEQNSQRSE